MWPMHRASVVIDSAMYLLMISLPDTLQVTHAGPTLPPHTWRQSGDYQVNKFVLSAECASVLMCIKLSILQASTVSLLEDQRITFLIIMDGERNHNTGSPMDGTPPLSEDRK